MAQIFKNEAVIFDLDDLLYKEFDFMRSGFWTLARLVNANDPKKLFRMMMAQYFLGNAVLDWLFNEYLHKSTDFTLESILSVYRNHKPDIAITAETEEFLKALKTNGNEIGLLTDGRALTQRNKIEALGLNKWVDVISISEECGYEKPSEQPFKNFIMHFTSEKFVYVADNFNKDFVAPNRLGWRTIALLDNGLNIHIKENNLNEINYPNEVITRLAQINISSHEI